MSLNAAHPIVNPRLGASFAIFTSAFVCLVIMLIILEQLGMSRETIGLIVILAPIAFYVAIGVLVRTVAVEDFFISGQRVPALYNGFCLAVNSLGATAVLSVTGALFFIGVDALAIGAGMCAGLALIALLFSSHLRKAGAYTLPGFLGLRHSSRTVRLIAALLLVPPCLFLLAAELKLAALAAGFFFPRVAQDVIVSGAAVFAVAIVALGGMRSLTWTQCAQSIVIIFGLGIPIVAVSLMLTNLPLPQLTYGYILQEVGQLEVAKSLIGGPPAPTPVSEALPNPGFQPLLQPFAKLFGSLSIVDFILLCVCVMIGGAVMPIQIARLSTTPTVPTVRKSLGWSVLITGIVVMTLPCFAVFVKYFVAQDLSGQPLTEVPAWGQAAKALGLINITGESLNPAGGESETTLRRDAIVLLLPLAAKLPYAMFGVVASAAIAAALAAMGAQMIAIANAMSNDVYYNVLNRTASPSRRLFIARLFIILCACGAVYMATQLTYDPLRMALWAFSLCGATFFPAMLLSVWWTRTNATSVSFGMATGFGVTALCILAGESGGVLGVDSLTAAAIGAPMSALVISVMNIMAPSPNEETKEFVEEMRLSTGETLHARFLRLAAKGRGLRP
jgi:cation/acetate symporter